MERHSLFIMKRPSGLLSDVAAGLATSVWESGGVAGRGQPKGNRRWDKVGRGLLVPGRYVVAFQTML